MASNHVNNNCSANDTPPLPVLTNDASTWKNASFLSVTQLSLSGISLLFEIAQDMKMRVKQSGGNFELCRDKVMACVFYEASTRTNCSFQAAMIRLGGSVITVDGKGNTSAAQKGESLSDTIRCLECYVDISVLRHSQQGSVRQVLQSATKPLVNAGDGIGEHPTQALLDVFTIWDELNLLNSETNPQQQPLVIVLLGDLKNGRTVHSLAKLLAQCYANEKVNGRPKLTLRYCFPMESLGMPTYIQEYISDDFRTVRQEVNCNLHEAVQDANVLYVTRIQKERFESQEQYNKVKGSYIVDASLLEKCPSNMVVMHPLPRVDEVSTQVDKDPRAAYFRQMENGMYVRMALLALLLGKVE